ncbi:MAG TPA: hypothetical protein VHE10_02290 [Candidatus Paceibacterota bacterium]|nr:hypothetical protein [Candidatus Paceibacterota bacterium]
MSTHAGFAAAAPAFSRLGALFRRFAGRESAFRPVRGGVQNGIIRFKLTGRGMTDEQWLARFKARGIRVEDQARSVLRTSEFKPAEGVVAAEVAILKDAIWRGCDRSTENIRVFAAGHGLGRPNADLACLIRDSLSDQEIEAMGLRWIVAMHEPIKDPYGDPGLLAAGPGRCLDAYCVRPGQTWKRGIGFAFIVPQASP